MKQYPPRPHFISPEKLQQLWLIIPICTFLCFCNGGIPVAFLVITVWIGYQVSDSQRGWEHACDNDLEFVYTTQEYINSTGYVKVHGQYYFVTEEMKEMAHKKDEEWKQERHKIIEWLKEKEVECEIIKIVYNFWINVKPKYYNLGVNNEEVKKYNDELFSGYNQYCLKFIEDVVNNRHKLMEYINIILNKNENFYYNNKSYREIVMKIYNEPTSKFTTDENVNKIEAGKELLSICDRKGISISTDYDIIEKKKSFLEEKFPNFERFKTCTQEMCYGHTVTRMSYIPFMRSFDLSEIRKEILDHAVITFDDDSDVYIIFDGSTEKINLRRYLYEKITEKTNKIDCNVWN